MKCSSVQYHNNNNPVFLSWEEQQHRYSPVGMWRLLVLLLIITRRQKVSWSILSFCSKALSSCVHALLNEQSLSLSLLPLTMKLRRVNKRLPRQPLLAGAFIAQSRRWVILKGEVIMCISECVNVGIAFVLSPFHYSTRHISPDSSRTSSITSTSSLFGS